MTNYNDGKWHCWNGGECPVHLETVVEIVYIDNGIVHKSAICKYCDFSKDAEFPIIAFRVTKEHKEPRRIWVIEHPDKLDVVNYDSEKFARSYAGPSAIRIVEFVEVLK